MIKLSYDIKNYKNEEKRKKIKETTQMTKIMTPAERAICALNLGQPDEIPTFELEFQLSEEFFGFFF